MTIKKIISLIYKPRFLYIKISRRIFSALKSLKIRIIFYKKSHSARVLYDFHLDEIPNLSTKPGNNLFFDDYYRGEFPYIENDFSNVLLHKIKIFSNSHYDVNINEPKNLCEIKSICRELPSSIVEAYKPIDWHCDFKSNYRWDDQKLYLDIPLSPVTGVDIKVPRELSRFQHIGEMFFSDREQASSEFFLEIADWISANPLGRGVNWACTMDVAIRAVNWIWGIRFYEKELDKYPHLKKILFNSLIEHGYHIYNNLEYYEENTGNHYLSNIVGLLYISALIPGYKDSDIWLMFSIQELVSEMEREVLDDGYSHEASTHYHRLVTELFLSASILIERVSEERKKRLLLVNIKNHKVKPRLKSIKQSKLCLNTSNSILPKHFFTKLKLMIEFTLYITKPNGLVPQIGDNDSARLHKLVPHFNQDYRDHKHILAVGELFFGSKSLLKKSVSNLIEAQIITGDLLHDSHFDNNDFTGKSFYRNAGIGVLKNNTAFLLVSCGSNGQNKMGGHGHNDKNSFELNVDGLDFVVDGGCPYYTSNPDLRNQYRSTFAHNTLGIEGIEQDTWQEGIGGLFSLEELCNPQLIKEDNIIRGSHKGYGEIHTREFKLNERNLIINDCCKSKGIKYLLFNLDPKVKIKRDRIVSNIFSAILTHEKAKNVQIQITGIEESEVTSGHFSKGFGLEIKNNMLKVKMSSKSSKTTFSW
jgi:hypothetical protein